MKNRTPNNPNKWLAQVFKAKSVRKGDVIRRQMKTVNKIAGQGDLISEVKRRQFHLLESGSQYIVLCNDGCIKFVC